MSGDFNTGVSEVMTSRSSLLLQVAELCSLGFDLNLMARNRPPELSGAFHLFIRGWCVELFQSDQAIVKTFTEWLRFVIIIARGI